jgi:hypothetical protein
MMKTHELYAWIGEHTWHGSEVRILVGDKVHEITEVTFDQDNNRAILITKEVG